MHLPLPMKMDPVFTTFFRLARAAFIGSLSLTIFFLGICRFTKYLTFGYTVLKQNIFLVLVGIYFRIVALQLNIQTKKYDHTEQSLPTSPKLGS